jgi:hypothetical protein
VGVSQHLPSAQIRQLDDELRALLKRVGASLSKLQAAGALVALSEVDRFLLTGDRPTMSS